MDELRPIAQRIVNAENSFVLAVQEQFGKTEAEAEKILEVFKAEKIVILETTGQFSLSDGIFWDAQVMDNALTLFPRY